MRFIKKGVFGEIFFDSDRALVGVIKASDGEMLLGFRKDKFEELPKKGDYIEVNVYLKVHRRVLNSGEFFIGNRFYVSEYRKLSNFEVFQIDKDLKGGGGFRNAVEA